MGDQISAIKPLTRSSYKEQVSRSITWGHYFIFVNILQSCVVGFSYVYAAPPTQSFLSFFYLLVTWLGHMSFLTVVAYLVIFFPLAFIGNFRYYRVIAVSIAVLLHTILLYDIKIFLLVKIHLSLTALGLIVRELDFDTGLNYNFLFIAVPFVIALECFFAKITTHSLYKAHHPLFVRSVLIVVGACFVCSHVLHIWADATKYERITILRTTFPLHYPMTAKSFLSGHGWLSEDLANANSVSGMEYIRYPLTGIHSNPDSDPSNVIIISFNGLSYSDLSPELTPELVRFKQSVQSFEQNYLLYKDEIDNVFALNYGLPLQYRPALLGSNVLPVTLEEMFRQDYVRRVVVSALLSPQDRVAPEQEVKDNQSKVLAKANLADSVERPEVTEHSVFDRNPNISLVDLIHQQQAPFKAAPSELNYLDRLARNTGVRDTQVQVTTTDSDALEYALSRLSSERPYALTLVLNDLRKVRFTPVAEIAQDDLTANLDPQVKRRNAYEQVLKRSDAAFGKFIRALQQRSEIDNTLIIVTSTEGNMLKAIGGQAFERQVQQVPLMVAWPRGELRSSSESELSTQRDIAATLGQEVLKISNSPGNYGLGYSLKSMRHRDFVISDAPSLLILVGAQDTTIYDQDGSAYVERDGRHLQVRPNLEDLIQSTRDLNRFMR